MKKHIGTTSATALGIVLLAAAGAAGASGSAPVIGRFQIACTDSQCYLVDTATGQVWASNGPRDEFLAPKIDVSSPAVTAEASAYLGRWAKPQDPSGQQWSLRIDPGGHAFATNDDRELVGSWTIEDDHIVIVIDDEGVAGELLPDGRLRLWGQGDRGDQIILTRVPGDVQDPTPGLSAAASGFLGRWICDEPDEEEITLQIEPGGRIVGIEDDGDMHEGHWTIQGTQLSMSFEDEEGLVGTLLPDGRLSIWQEDDKDERLTFKRMPSKRQESAQQTSQTSGFLGQWISDEPEEGDLGLRLEPGGKAIATEGEKRYDGQWRIEGSRLFLTVDDDEHTGQLLPDGRLSLWEDGNPDRRLTFKRPPTEAQVQDMTAAAAEAGFLGRWVSADPDEDNLGLQIEPAGVAIATNERKRYEGSWSLSGSRLTLRVEDDELLGEVTADGRLTLQEKDGGDTVVFRRPAP